MAYRPKNVTWFTKRCYLNHRSKFRIQDSVQTIESTMKALTQPVKWLTCLTALTLSHQVMAYCSAQKSIEHEIDAEGLTELRINALAGELIIEAADNDQVEVRGNACADRDIYLDRMQVTLEKKDGVAELTVVIPYHERDWHADYAYIDLSIEVPASLSQLIKDSSGDLEADGVKIELVNDSSGDIRLRNTSGELSLRDSAGFISVRDHKGDVEVQDSSGDVDLEAIDGDVTIVRDSSGDIEIDMVSGQVNVERDSSGDIEIDAVGKNVIVGADGSGEIKIRDVKGSVEIGSDGSGDIIVQRIDGDFVLRRKGSGDIRTAKVQGDISIPTY